MLHRISEKPACPSISQGFLRWFLPVAGAVASSIIWPAQIARAQRVLISPSDDTLCLLYYRAAKQTPPFDQLAGSAASVKNANEFDQPKALADEEARLKSLYDSLATVQAIEVTINMSFGTYDAQLGEYDLSGFGAGYYLPYTCFDQTPLQLEFDNSEYAGAWQLSPEAAEDVLNRNGGNRDVSVLATIAITDITPSAPGEPLILLGDIKRVDILGANTNAPLGHYAVTGQ